jgi:hypothetical protein
MKHASHRAGPVIRGTYASLSKFLNFLIDFGSRYMQSGGDGETRVRPDSWITLRFNASPWPKTLQALMQLILA